MDEDDGIQLIDPESYMPSKEEGFSHETLIMKAMKKIIDAGCKEMRGGWFNKKIDKFGEISYVYIEDTRKAFVESVETLKMIMACDLDEEAKKKIKEIEDNLDLKFKMLCNEEKMEWESSNIILNRNKWKSGVFFRKEKLNPNLPYYQEYIEEEIKAYRKIFEELSKLTGRKDFWKEGSMDA